MGEEIQCSYYSADARWAPVQRWLCRKGEERPKHTVLQTLMSLILSGKAEHFLLCPAAAMQVKPCVLSGSVQPNTWNITLPS